ncbi:DUF1353 domain-containing protein [Methylophilaceae bacterium]|nr:DUF1353 domain-containing protein [Methylophilaceae bacterium]
MSKFNGLMDSKFHPPKTWVLNTKLTYEDDHLTDNNMQALKEVGAPIDMRSGKVTAPAGLKTDMASVPRAAWLFIAPFDCARAAVIHDVLYAKIRHYRYHGGEDNIAFNAKRVADLVFKHAMDDAEPAIPSWKKFLCYQAVNWFGKSSVEPTEADK